MLEQALTSAGEHRLTIEARSGEKPLDTAETAFLVLAEDVETEQRRANPELLRRLAHQTGGGVFTPTQAPEAFERLLHREPALELKTPTVLTGTASAGIAAALLVVFVATVTGEWILRHRRGLP